MTKKRVHFIGIGGIGISALARWYLAQKWAVSGSDVEKGPLTQELQKQGIRLKIGPNRAHNLPPGVALVIHTQAVDAANPELRAAKRKGILTLSYPKALAAATEGKTLIAICGAHGKSTTTALAALTLVRAGLDPTVVVGTKLKEFSHRGSGKEGINFRNGKGKYFVIEADEYGRSFHNYSPAFAVCTNVDAEHLDTYKNLAGVKKGFLKFFSRVVPGGTLILNKDDANLASLARRVKKIARANHLRVIWYSLKSPVAKKISRLMKIPGRHNASNALAVRTLAKALGIPDKISLSAIGAYRGSWRRFEYRGKFAFSLPATHYPLPTTLLYDDYAHHPTEIRATLKGFREKFPKKKIVCVFQPHQAKRLKALFGEFQSAFEDADTVLIMPIYKVAGREASRRRDDYDREYARGDDRWDSAALVRAMQKKSPGRPIFYLSNPAHLKSALTVLLTSDPKAACVLDGRKLEVKNQNKSAVIVMMGAGNIIEYTNAL